jgi:ferritin-like metal-binding protein YciE
MSIQSLKDLYLDELGDLYDAEMQMIRALARLTDAARAPELKEALSHHCDESRLHLERLQLIFTHWGEKTRSHQCAGLAGIVQEADDRLTEAATPDARDAAIIGAAQRIEHYEIAAYGCARTYARRLNRPDEARLLQETLVEEGRADHRLTEIAEAHVNDDARAETDVQPKRANSGLRYVELRQAAREVTSEPVREVMNDAGEKLGVFDGLLVNESGSPRYAVVATGHLFTSRRVLLPLSVLRFDERARVLRVPLDREIARRYPEFDRAEVERMDAADFAAYERRLFDLLSKEHAADPIPPIAEGQPPEWLVKSMWTMKAPDRTETLADEVVESTPEESATPHGHKVHSR